MGRFLAIGGGTFEDTDGLTRRIVDLSKKEIPNILFIGTAAEDSTNPLTSCKKSFKRVCPGTVMKKLSIIRNTYTMEEVDELLNWADIIYVGPGNTEFMLEKWQEYGLTAKLKAVFEKDTAVLSGMSAGALCWFSLGFTDSDYFKGEENWSYRMIRPGFDLFNAAFCPHYGDWKRSGFDEKVEEAWKEQKLTGEILGIALEDCTGFVYDNGAVSFAKSQEDVKAWVFKEKDGTVVKETVTFENI